MENQTIEVTLPTRCTVLVHQSTDPANGPGIWLVDAMVDAIDVKTGQPAHFTTKWKGGEPSKADIAQTVVTMLAHEVFEQLGLDPHQRTDVFIPDAPHGFTAADIARLKDEVEMWKRRAAKHGCDITNGDPDCG